MGLQINTNVAAMNAYRNLANTQGAMSKSLEDLPEEVREVVRLRLFEDQEIAEIAEKLSLGESAVRHRFRKGAELYRERLRALLGPTTSDLT